MNPKFTLSCPKGLALLFLTLFSFHNTSAQKSSTFDTSTPQTFLGMGIGINDYGIGIGLEQTINDHFSFYGMGGLSTWGLRATGGLTYYLKQSGFGSSFSLGYSHASGTDNLKVTLEALEYYGGYGSDYGGYGGYGGYGYGYQPIEAYDEDDVTLELYSYGTINLMYAYNLRVGTKSKFVFSGGYSIPLENDVYMVKSGHILTEDSKTFIDWMAPGGFIIGVKFMLGV